MACNLIFFSFICTQRALHRHTLGASQQQRERCSARLRKEETVLVVVAAAAAAAFPSFSNHPQQASKQKESNFPPYPHGLRAAATDDGPRVCCV